MSGKSTIKNFKALMSEAKLPARTVLICLRGDLVAEHEQAERDLEQAQRTVGDSLAGGTAVAEIVEQIEALEEQMRESQYPFRLRALPRPQWRDLVAAHPPRRGEDGAIVDTDRPGVNADTFFEAMIRACLIDPELTDEEWKQLDETLTDRQFDDLSDAAWAVNRREVDIPFSRAASRMRRASVGE